MAYCTADDVVTLLGGEIASGAEDAAQALLDAAAEAIDGYVGESWTGGTVTAEVQTVRCGEIHLDRVPISGVTSITVQPKYIGATPRVLVANSTYQIIDARHGIVLVSATEGDVATVTYTHAPEAVPEDIVQASAMLIAHWIRHAIDPTALTLSKLRAGSAELTYREYETGWPADVKAILDGHGSPSSFVMV